jgi:hypothetical protein
MIDPQQTSRPRWKALWSPLLNAETPSSRLSLTGCNPLQAEWATGKGTFVRTFSVRARHQPDFEWRAEREFCTVNPVQEAGALRPIPVEPSEEKCHNDRACGRTHPCRSEA